MLRLGDDILDDAVGPAAAREVRDHGQRATGHQLRFDERPEVANAPVRLDFMPDRFDPRGFRKGLVGVVEMFVEMEQCGKVGVGELTYLHGRIDRRAASILFPASYRCDHAMTWERSESRPVISRRFQVFALDATATIARMQARPGRRSKFPHVRSQTP